jgi:type IV pilus assembly protein PilC
MVIIGILMAIFVLPKLTATFKEFNTALPLSTRIVVAITDFMAARPVTILGGLVLLIAGSIAFFRTPVGMRTLDWVLLHFPLINPIVKKINIARFARILSSLMKSGVAIIEGLKVTSDAMENSYYREVIDQTSENVKVGKPLTEALAVDPKLFPFIISQMLAIGEETGNLETILEQIAVHYEQEIDNTMKDLSSIIEPLLLLTIGGVVGVLAIALIGPIYNIGQSIG